MCDTLFMFFNEGTEGIFLELIQLVFLIFFLLF